MLCSRHGQPSKTPFRIFHQIVHGGGSHTQRFMGSDSSRGNSREFTEETQRSGAAAVNWGGGGIFEFLLEVACPKSVTTINALMYKIF